MPPSKATSHNYDPNVVFAFAQEFAKNMQTTTATIQELLGELNDHSVVMVQLKEQFSAMKENVTALNQLVSHEGPEGSMMTRMVVMKNRVAILEEWKDKKIKSEESERKESTKGRYAIYVALITGVLGFIGTITGLIVNFLIHKTP